MSENPRVNDGTIDALNETVTRVGNRGSLGVLIEGTFVGTIRIQKSYDNGVTWRKIRDITAAMAEEEVIDFDEGGKIQVQAKAIAWTSGSATVAFMDL